MKGVFFITLVFMALCLIACENEAEKNGRFAKVSAQLDGSVEDLEKNVQKAQEEQEKNWHRSAKERFLQFYDFEKDAGKLLNEKNIRSVSFIKKSPLEYVATVSIKADNGPLNPSYIIFLYNRKGLIIGSFYLKRKFFGHKIPKGQVEEQQHTIKLTEQDQPFYFRIDYPHE